METIGSSARTIDAHAAESAIHLGSSRGCARASGSTLTWRTNSDLFASERTTWTVRPHQGCHRYDTTTSVPWAFCRMLVPPRAQPPGTRQRPDPARRSASSEQRSDRPPRTSRRPPQLLPSLRSLSGIRGAATRSNRRHRSASGPETGVRVEEVGPASGLDPGSGGPVPAAASARTGSADFLAHYALS